MDGVMDPDEMRALARMIDFDSSQQESKIVIHAGVDPRMDELLALLEGKSDLDKLSDFDAATDELLLSIEPNSLRSQLSDISVHMMPQLGCLIQVQSGPDRPQRDIPQDWSLQFHDDDGHEYYKNVTMRQLDNTLGDLLGQQADLTVDIAEDLAIEVRKAEAMLLEIDQVVAELDCILAMTATCETFGLVRPRMVDENVLIIQKGRHILYEMANETYISNDTDMRNASDAKGEAEDDAIEETQDQSLTSAFQMLITGANGLRSTFGRLRQERLRQTGGQKGMLILFRTTD
ncbi:hypothetical protein QFC22_002232 [Naganishia vaughanmartiniae]|uniref:Uncharacterized protein n=1 Tax=Naganishia vaughanmartiniae TaxID=1424756 RepID=A0ACC2XCF4_9TREE|nr:hypothetical protein QFC22_002232 [Naganishia vaughanmartiniae]